MPDCLPVFFAFWVALVPDRFAEVDAGGEEGGGEGVIASFPPPPPPPPPAARAGFTEGAILSATTIGAIRIGASIRSLIATLIIRASLRCYADFPAVIS